ncbi:MAG: AAA family ATPase [Armatimonadota bacterium]
MRIRSITVQGFRGFNDERTIDLHDRLTLVYAPNSYGKTSISEALEWLLYGTTSKFVNADYKGEYKGSFRNPHFPDTQNPTVRVVLANSDQEYEMRGELVGAEDIRRSLNGSDVATWDFLGPMTSVGRPFILQHSLKDLLHVEPAQRFERFASILGLQHIDEVQRNIVALCTRYDSAIPTEVKELVQKVHALQERVEKTPELLAVARCFKGKKGCSELRSAIEAACKCKLPEDTPCDAYLPALIGVREETVSKLFSGSVKLVGFTEIELGANKSDEDYCLSCIGEAFIKDYLAVAKLATVGHILKRAQFMGLGVDALTIQPDVCPFCGQELTEALVASLQAQHKTVAEEAKANEGLNDTKRRLEQNLNSLRLKAESCYNRHIQLVSSILATETATEKLEKLLLPKHKDVLTAIQNAVADLKAQKTALDTAAKQVKESIVAVKQTLEQTKPSIDTAQKLAEDVIEFVAKARGLASTVAKHAPPIASANHVLQQQLDALAGTADISALIDLLDGWKDVERAVRIDSILDSLKDLRKTTDLHVSTTMLNAVSGEFSKDVMDWYKQIRTEGDPDVHFQGFDMERTVKGELKARKVHIKASSYGKDLISAVSSLSESKLNALGLCLSIATNLKANTPFGFLLIDDPIQSWDADHETRFIDVIRKLVESGKQVVLLSHNKAWIKQVRLECRSLNGWYYEITGYSKEGPNINQVSWDEWSNRLSTVDAILKDNTADDRKLQQAEEEIRIAVGDITSQLYKKRTGVVKNPNKLNSKAVRKMLIECNVKPELVDKIVSTFGTTDDSHHDPNEYSPNRERIRCYHNWAHDLAQCLKN